MSMQSKLVDSTALIVGAASAALASIPAINNYLQMIVLVLTIVFMALGIALRARKIRGGDEE